ncbi:hypothetical protein [Prosthecomicrobium hirschii]|uniref:hypothetical protein n=1 Tax=Prosthecodimorpha hirschii TaxID=665126 RepID=UPI00221FE3BF|nr:hypothetical protein [Prosthecomicrobium hirschii]MCW1838758.1 hypothetical protein [Prosthecomicrobium hirschii]
MAEKLYLVSAYNLAPDSVLKINSALGLRDVEGAPAAWLARAQEGRAKTYHLHRCGEIDQVQVSVEPTGRSPAAAMSIDKVLGAALAEFGPESGYRLLPWSSALECAREGLGEVLPAAEIVEAFKAHADPAAALAALASKHRGTEIEERCRERWLAHRAAFVTGRMRALDAMSREGVDHMRCELAWRMTSQAA